MAVSPFDVHDSRRVEKNKKRADKSDKQEVVEKSQAQLNKEKKVPQHPGKFKSKNKVNVSKKKASKKVASKKKVTKKKVKKK